MENETIDRILASGIMSYFVFEDLDHDRSLYEDMTQDDFIKNFKVNDAFMSRFEDYINSRTRYKTSLAAYKDEIKLYIKATLAEQLFGSQAYEEVINSNDVMLDEIRQLIADDLR